MNSKWYCQCIILGEEKAHGQIHIRKERLYPVIIANTVCGWWFECESVTWYYGQAGRVPWGHTSLICRSPEEISLGLKLAHSLFPHVLRFLSLPSPPPIPLLVTITYYCFQLGGSHHIMLLPTSISLIEVLFIFYSVCNRDSFPAWWRQNSGHQRD